MRGSSNPELHGTPMIGIGRILHGIVHSGIPPCSSFDVNTNPSLQIAFADKPVLCVNVSGVQVEEQWHEPHAANENRNGAEEPQQERKCNVEATGANREEVATLGQHVGNVVRGDANERGAAGVFAMEGDVDEEVGVVDVSHRLHVAEKSEAEAEHD